MTNDSTHTKCTYVADKFEPKNWHADSVKQWKLENDSWKCPHDALDRDGTENAEYCVFHTAPEKIPEDIDQAEEFLRIVEDAEKNEDGKRDTSLELVGAVFTNFEIDKENMKGVLRDHTVRFDHSKFIGKFSATDVIFGDISFDGVEFHNGAFFNGATFSGESSFNAVEFSGRNSFRNSEFQSLASFDSSCFNDGVSFNDAVFEGEVSFNPGYFSGDVSFISTKFTGDSISFVNSEYVSKSGSFKEFDQISFRDADFITNGEILFSRVNFSDCNHLSFRGAKFTGELFFPFADFRMINKIDFSEIRISVDGAVSFFRSLFNGSKEISFINSIFNNKGTISFNSTEFKRCNSVDFTKTKFRGGEVRFDESDFTGCNNVSFRSTMFETSVVFHETKFSDETDFRQSDFSKGEIYASSFENMNLKGVDFTGQNLRNINFNGSNVENALFSRANLSNADFTGAKIDGTVLADARIDHKTDFGENINYRVPYDPTSTHKSKAKFTHIKYTFLKLISPAGNEYIADDSINDKNYKFIGEDEKTNNDKMDDSLSHHNQNDDLLTRYIKAARSYHSLQRIGQNNSLPDLQTIGYVRRQEMQRNRYLEKGQRIKWFRATISRYTLLYGESPKHVMGFALFVITIAGLLYPLGGFRVSDTNKVIQASSFNEWLVLLPDGMYFSTLTFTTLGFGDFEPVGWGKVLAVTETGLGVTILALLVFVLGRRAAR